MERFRKRAARAVLPFLLLACSLLLGGCGRRLVMTKGFAKDELFRVGNTECLRAEENGSLLNRQQAGE